ncbi:MAG: ribosomal L7Ae/L30e/S12e/Gadd45 family protein [Clostridia bacterium]|nr:ribosomal L7Ae/L30e/S12e/Gadd45 family protein [Clostridia bacterium]
MNNNSVISLLGFAAKAGKLLYGTHSTEWAISVKKAKLVLVAEDISEKSKKEIKFKADKMNVPVVILDGIDTDALSSRIGKRCGIIAVNDEGFANTILKEEKRYDGEI